MGPSGLPATALAVAIAGLVFSMIPCCCITWVVGLPLNAVALYLSYRALGDIAQGIASEDGAGNAKVARGLAFAGFALNALWLAFQVLVWIGAIGLSILSAPGLTP